MTSTIKLCKLVPSPRNVRRRTDAKADLELKADIEARGLLQNLVVTPAGKPRGSFAVEAGERRRRALQALAEEGKLAKDHEVPCLVIESEGSREASLAENFQRLSMNPADECLAFRQLIEDGSDIASVARRFGLTERFVEGRLRLAGLAKVVFEALGAGEISLDVAKAYAAVPDAERQAWVFDQVGRSYAGGNPDSIRRMMTQASVGESDRRALFVGEEAYVAAGGLIERDLFSSGGAARWLDVALLERLAGEKLECEAAEAAAASGLAFVRPILESWISNEHLEGLRRVHAPKPALTDADNEELDALEAESEALAERIEDEETPSDDRSQAERRASEIASRISEIVDRTPVVGEALAGKVGAFMILDDQGRPRLDRGLYADADVALEGEDARARDGREPGNRPSTGLSQRLVDELAMQRRDILALHVAADPALALDLAIFLMIDREAFCSPERSGSSLIASPPSNPVPGFECPDAPATVAREQASGALDRSWMAGASRAGRFDAFRALGEEERAAWLGHAVAKTLEASLNVAGERSCAFHDHLGRLIGIDVARWWRPTGANYFDRVAKGLSLAALEEVGGEALAARYSKAKKAELAGACERIFSGDFIADAEVKEAALAWVPRAMTFAQADCGEEMLPGAEAGSGDRSAELPVSAEGEADCDGAAAGADRAA